MAEQNSAAKLKQVREARTKAKAELRTARENLEQIKKALTTLEAEKRPIREQRDRNEAELQRLDGQLGERRREEESIAAQVQRQNEQTDRIRGTEGRSDERAQAESRLAALTIQLHQLQNKIAGLEILRRQARDRQTELDAHLQELDGRIAEKNQERNSAEEEVKSKEAYLSEKRAAVTEAVEAVKSEMVADPFKHLVGGPFKYIRDSIFQLRDMLKFFGVASAVYAYTLLSGFVHEIQFYRSNNLDISHYTTLSDFLLIPPVLWGIGAVAVTGVLVTLIFFVAKARGWVAYTLYRLIRLRPPVSAGLLIAFLLILFILERKDVVVAIILLMIVARVSGWVAYCLSHLVGRPVLRGLLIVTLLVSGPLLAGCWKYNPSGKERADVKKGDTVTVLTNPPLRNAEKLLLVGSNSNYMFFKNTTGNDSAGVKAISLSQIVCVGTDGCEAEAIGPDYVAEPLLQQFISRRMTCEEGEEPLISDLIRFVNDQPNPRCPECPSVAGPSAGSTDDNTRYEAMKALYQEKIGPKVQDIVKEFMDKSAIRWTVFGFASPDGEEVENDFLSRDRARVVIDEMCRLQENGTLDLKIDCDGKKYADPQVLYFGERHPINGISNSRSAVITACVPKTNG